MVPIEVAVGLAAIEGGVSWTLSSESLPARLGDWSLGLESKAGFLGTGGAGFRVMAEDVDMVDAWLDARDLCDAVDGWAFDWSRLRDTMGS